MLGTNCTAFCVAPNVVATAAHCLFRKPPGRILRLQDFTVEMGSGPQKRQSRIAGARERAGGQHIVTGTTRLRVRPPIDAGSDWALARTETPICKGRTLPVEVRKIRSIERASDRGRMFQIAHHSDWDDWSLAYSRPCKVRGEFPSLRRATIRRDFRNVRHLILHHCDTKGASSGSPLLEQTDDGIVAIGINVGTYIQSKVLIRNGQVARKFEARPVANTAINASAFIAHIDTLASANILTARIDIRNLQRGLARADAYRGNVDGVFGNNTRTAIIAFQKKRGLAPDGLPTRTLLAMTGGAIDLPLPAANPAARGSAEIGATRRSAVTRAATTGADGIARLLHRGE
ncbi:MAG: peptidoglycan-binding domain-containing protein [Pseudomonadota bacterium]